MQLLTGEVGCSEQEECSCGAGKCSHCPLSLPMLFFGCESCLSHIYALEINGLGKRTQSLLGSKSVVSPLMKSLKMVS